MDRAGGALVEATPEACRAKMEVYAADPKFFGVAKHNESKGGAEPLPDLRSDLEGYTMVEGFKVCGAVAVMRWRKGRPPSLVHPARPLTPCRGCCNRSRTRATGSCLGSLLGGLGGSWGSPQS